MERERRRTQARIPASQVRPVLEALGWQGELEAESYSRDALHTLVASSPSNAVFDWRSSAAEARETIEAIVPSLPRGWAKGARTVRAVQRAAQRAAADFLWIPWEANDESDTAMFLIVRAAVWRELEESWLPSVLKAAAEPPEPAQPDRGDQVREVALRVVTQLREQEALELQATDEATVTGLQEALAVKLRSLYAGHPALGAVLGDWLLGRPEVAELFLDDAELGAHVGAIWRAVIGKEEAFPVGGSPGDTVAISGTRFQHARWVRLGERECVITSSSPRLEVLVPSDMESGTHRLTVCCRTGTVVTSDRGFLVRGSG